MIVQLRFWQGGPPAVVASGWMCRYSVLLRHPQRGGRLAGSHCAQRQLGIVNGRPPPPASLRSVFGVAVAAG